MPSSPAPSTIPATASSARVIVYARCSKPEQDSSVEQQLMAAEVDLAALGHLRPGTRLPRRHAPESGVYIDDGVSASKLPPAQRKGAGSLLAYMAAHPQPADQKGVVWVWAQSRLLRAKNGGVEALTELYRYHQLGWVLYNHEQQRHLDLSGKEALLAAFLVLLHGQKDHDHAAEKEAGVRRGKAYQRLRGVWLGGNPPPGYERCPVRLSDSPDANTGLPKVEEWFDALERGQWNPYPTADILLQESADAAMIRDLFHVYAYGEKGQQFTINDLLRRLNDPKYEHNVSRLSWSRSGINGTLKNKTYLALQQDNAPPRDRLKRPKPVRNALPALWAPLVDRATWEAVQAKLASNRKERRPNSDFLLSGLIFCGACGDRMSGERQQLAVSGGSVAYYRKSEIRLHDDAQRCQECRQRVRAEAVEAVVVEELLRLADDPRVQAAVTAETEAHEAGHTSVATQRDALVAKRRAVADEMEKVLRYAMNNDEAKDLFDAKLAPLRADAKRLDRAIASLVDGAASPARANMDALGQTRVVFEAATSAEKRQMLKAFIAKVEVFAERRVVRVAIWTPGDVA